MFRFLSYITLTAAVLSAVAPVVADSSCVDEGVVLQVLGSGGPIADDARASSGYLLWIDGKARVLIDVGGGVFQRFGEAGGTIEDLDLIALTHVHTDHAADLPAILKGAYFSERTAPLPISGPSGAGVFPSVDVFLERMFGPEQGAFAYLSGLLDGSEGLPKLQVTEVDANTSQPIDVFSNDTFKVRAVGVHHSIVPTLGYLITVDDARIAISGDQNLSTDHFTRMVKGADLLVMPMAIPEYNEPDALHARPSDIGKMAARAKVDKLVLSHWMARSLAEQSRNISIVREYYQGSVETATDLMCIPTNQAD